MEMAVILSDDAGLHARPASLFVQAANKFASTITVACKGKQGNAKSILSLLALGAKQGDEVVIRAEGPDASVAVTALVNLVQNGIDH